MKNQNAKRYDLEERTLLFAKRIVDLVQKLPKNQVNNELISQVVRSGSSIGANYREANDSLGKKDFFMRMKISRKEAKETSYWLEILFHNNANLESIMRPLLVEVNELIKIFSAILLKSV